MRPEVRNHDEECDAWIVLCIPWWLDEEYKIHPHLIYSYEEGVKSFEPNQVMFKGVDTFFAIGPFKSREKASEAASKLYEVYPEHHAWPVPFFGVFLDLSYAYDIPGPP